jgi:hypothetical protein
MSNRWNEKKITNRDVDPGGTVVDVVARGISVRNNTFKRIKK